MSDNIPFDIQMEIIKFSDVKSLVRFRSVSKTWNAFIDNCEFVKGYGAHHTQPHSHILIYRSDEHSNNNRYASLVEDDIKTFKAQQPPFVVSSLLKQCRIRIRSFVGGCHGLLCLNGFYELKPILVIWNPSIGKSFGIDLSRYDYRTSDQTSYGFGVSPVTSDPTVVKLVCVDNKLQHAEVFRLSLGVWSVIPSGKLPLQTIRLQFIPHVAIDNFIYWGAWEMTITDHGEYVTKYMVVSFDLITQEFKVVNLPDTSTNEMFVGLSFCTLMGSLAMYGLSLDKSTSNWSVWVMENELSFRKLITIGAPVGRRFMLGFKKNGEIIFQTRDGGRWLLEVYNPSSEQIKNLGISGVGHFFFWDSYKESLLLLDHLDSHIYSDNN